MKKMNQLIALILCLAAALSLAACGKNTTVEAVNPAPMAQQDEAAGGWTRPDSPVVTDELRSKLEAALDGMLGATYVPVAFLGSQLVSGTNYRLLCRVAPVAPGAAETYAIVTIYEDLSGKVMLSEVDDSGVETNLSSLPGGWFPTESPALTDEAKAVFDRAMEGLVGVNYVPVALIADQIVNGTNRCFLCEATGVYPGAETSYALVYVHETSDGTAELGGILPLSGEGDPAGSSVQLPNPFVTYDSLADAAEAAGFDMTVPETVEGYSGRLVQVMNGSMIQVVFTEGDDRLFLRKAAGSEDISGDYNVYPEENTVSVNGCDVTFRGSDGAVNTAVWTSGGCTYAVTADTPLAPETMTALVGAVA